MVRPFRTQRVDRSGTVTDDPSLAAQGIRTTSRLTVPGIDHQIAAPFWEFMTSTGLVKENGQYVNQPLFTNPYYATGFLITEAYWARVKVAGTYKDVLMQCFERRCLTYTPGNPVGFATEAGNVGQHYRTWRYDQIPGEGGATPTSTSTIGEPTATSTTPSEQTPSYTYAGEWGGDPGEISALGADLEVAVDPDGKLWVADTDTDRALIFDDYGVLQHEWTGYDNEGEFNRPTEIAFGVDRDQPIAYILDSETNRVQHWSQDVTFWFGDIVGNGNDDGYFNHPTGVATYNGLLHVADTGNARIQIFTADGDFVTQITSDGIGGVIVPEDVEIGAEGTPYILDVNAHRLVVMTPEN
jgi:NHL repeat